VSQPNRPVRIASASGFYGDRLAAMRDIAGSGPVDVVTGDYLTMLILRHVDRSEFVREGRRP
jgi:hypothetical protein